MAEFSPNGITHYRAGTEKHAKNAGVVLNRRRCHLCGAVVQTTGGKLTRGFSRHQPSVFRCFDCVEKEGK